MKKRKVYAYIIVCVLIALVLSACGTQNKENKKDKTEVSENTKNEQDEKDNASTDVSNKDTKEDNDKGVEDDVNKDVVLENKNASIEQTPIKTEKTETTEKNEENKNPETTKPTTPSGGAGNTNGSTNQNNDSKNNEEKPKEPSQTKTPVKEITEEASSGPVAFKYGITKQEVCLNKYMTYSDGSKELLSSSVKKVTYDSTNYSATDEQLKNEVITNTSKYNNFYEEVLRLVNEIRAEAGVGPLVLDTNLCKAASHRALEMDYDNLMSHTRPNGSTCWTILGFYNISYRTCGENVAAGQTSPQVVVTAWKNSQGHYENMINPAFNKLGVGYSSTGVGSYKHYWCQMFSN